MEQLVVQLVRLMGGWGDVFLVFGGPSTFLIYLSRNISFLATLRQNPKIMDWLGQHHQQQQQPPFIKYVFSCCWLAFDDIQINMPLTRTTKLSEVLTQSPFAA